MFVAARLASTGVAVAVALISASSNSTRTHDQLRVPASDKPHREGAENRDGHENAEPAYETALDHDRGHEEGQRNVKVCEHALHSDPLRFRLHEPREHEIETPPGEVQEITRRDDDALLRVN